jgi:hypothetical protein
LPELFPPINDGIEALEVCFDIGFLVKDQPTAENAEVAEIFK